MAGRLRRLAETLGFLPAGGDDVFEGLDAEYMDVDPDRGSLYYEADPVSSLDITDPARTVAEYDFPDLNLSQNVDYSAFSRLTELAGDRETQYAAYDAMTSDPIISSALEMYADDASQYDSQGRLIWAEGEDAELVDYVDNLLDTLGVGKMLWGLYYNLALYGDVYIRLFKQTNEIYDPANYPYSNIYDQMELDENILDVDSKYLPYVEVVTDPENVYDLVKNGKTVQYAHVVRDPNTPAAQRNQVELFPPDQFVHIYIENPHIRDREDFSFDATDADGVRKTYTFDVRRGKSMLHDVYPVEREVQLLENALLLNRISKSAITRLVQVEVGDLPKPEVRKITRRLKSSLEAKLSVNAQTRDMKNYLSSSGIDNLIVSPTRDGKGGVTIENIQSDPEIKSLADLDYFTDKRFGGLHIPKAFMGYDETLSANSGGTLVQLDARYGRTIKRLQTCVMAGVTDMVNLFLVHDNRLKDVGEYKIRVVSPTTADDIARDENLRNKIGMVSDILNMFDDESGVDKAAMFQHLITALVGDSRISDEIYRQRVEKLRQQREDPEAAEAERDARTFQTGDFTDFGDIDAEKALADDEDDGPQRPTPKPTSRQSPAPRPQESRRSAEPSGEGQSVSPGGGPAASGTASGSEPAASGGTSETPGVGAVGTSEIDNFV